MEKYGTIPKKFTKAWWEYVWDYYKFHIAAVLFVLFFIGSIVHTNLNRKYYDMYITYIGKKSVDLYTEDVFRELFIPVLEETNGDGKIDIAYNVYNVENPTYDNLLTEEEYATESRIMVDLEAGDSFFYILSRANAENLYEQSNCFEPVWVYKPDALEEDVIMSKEDYPFALSLAGNQKLIQKGIDPSNLYLAVKKVYPREQDDERKIKIHQNSINAAKLLLEQ